MSKLIDLTGQDFGYWHVISRAENDSGGRARWNCVCTACGTQKVVAGGHLRRGNSTNCGCIRMEKMRQSNIKDERGKIYGYLKVVREATLEEKMDKVTGKNLEGIYWNCTCLNCGKTNFIVKGDYLRNGDTTSCGCILSKNEKQIEKMLNNACIQYKTQYSFDDLRSPENENYKLKFDFAIFNGETLLYLIEYDGSQHFKYFYDENNGSWNNKENYLKTRKRDRLKNEYCFKNNIPLIRIPYNKEYKLSDLRLETTNFLLTKENELQYYSL